MNVIEALTLQHYRVSTRRRLMLLFEFGLLLTTSAVAYFFDARQLDPVWLSVFKVFITYLGVHIILSAIRISMVSRYRLRNKLEEDDRDNFTIGMNALVSLFSVIATAVAVFVFFELDFLQIWTTLAVVSVALAILLQPYITNFINSFLLMFSDDYKVGEYVRLNDGSKGYVQDITFRATKLKTDEGNILFVPNTKFVENEVTNFSKVKFKKITMAFSVARSEVKELYQFEERLKDELTKAFPDLVVPEKIYLRVNHIHETAVDLTLESVVTNYNFRIEEEIKKWVAGYILATTTV